MPRSLLLSQRLNLLHRYKRLAHERLCELLREVQANGSSSQNVWSEATDSIRSSRPHSQSYEAYSILKNWLDTQRFSHPNPERLLGGRETVATRRKLSEEDVADFLASRPTQKPIPTMTVRRVQHDIMVKNPVRWMRLQKDLKWLQRVVKKMGYQPEDARWLL